MKWHKNVFLWAVTFVGMAVFVMSSAAWLHIQSVRWGYQAQGVQCQLDDIAKREQSLDQRLQSALALNRLDQLAKTKFNLQIPQPSQIVLLTDVAS